jgi:hypothetical protein
MPLATIELVVAGHHQHRHWPVGEAFVSGPAGIDVAGQHQHVGSGRGQRIERLGLEMEVGQQLQLHGGDCRGAGTSEKGGT